MRYLFSSKTTNRLGPEGTEVLSDFEFWKPQTVSSFRLTKLIRQHSMFSMKSRWGLGFCPPVCPELAGGCGDVRTGACPPWTAPPPDDESSLIHLDFDAADTCSESPSCFHGNQGKASLSTYFRNLIKSGSRTAAVFSTRGSDSHGLILRRSGDLGCVLGQTIENV